MHIYGTETVGVTQRLTSTAVYALLIYWFETLLACLMQMQKKKKDAHTADISLCPRFPLWREQP